MKSARLFQKMIMIAFIYAGLNVQSVFAQDNSWKFESQREQISPKWFHDTKTTFNNKPTLGLSGGGKDYVDGHWSKIVSVTGGESYHFNTFFKATKVEEPGRCIQGRVIWLDKGNKQVGFTEYPVTSFAKSPEGWNRMESQYVAPVGTTNARLELHYRWDGDGSVNFTEATFDRK